MTDIAERRTKAEAKLSELRTARGAAVLDKKNFDLAKIDALESEIASLDAAEGEQARRERAAISANRLKRRTELRKQLSALEDVRLRAVQDANQAARDLARSFERVLTTNAEMAKVATEITGGKAPSILGTHGLVQRLAGRLAAVMQSIPGYPARFGSIVWQGASLYRHVDDWRAAEQATFEPHLNPLIEKESENGKNSKS